MIDVQKAINLALPAWAVIDGPYRYALGRGLGGRVGEVVAWVMLNPSTADALKDDPTIRKVKKFSRMLAGHDARVVVVNLYAWRATKPAALCKAHFDGNDVIGQTWNTIAIGDALAAAKHVVVAWGANKGPLHIGRVAEVMRQIERRSHTTLCLGRTDDGSPRHPLMLPYSTAFEEYT